MASKPGKLGGGMDGANAHDVMRSLTDELAEKYASVANDGSKSSNDREAAMFYTVAEQHLEDSDDFEECMKAASEALKLFRNAGDGNGVADSVRLIIHAQRAKAESLGHGVTAEDRRRRVEILDEAEQTAIATESDFKASNNTRGQAAMRLCFAEINMMSGRGTNKRAEGEEAVFDAEKLAKGAGDVKLEAAIASAMISVHLSSKAGYAEAKAAAEKALELYQQSGNQKNLAKAWHMVGYTRVLSDEFDHGLQAATKALQLFGELGLRKFEAFENFVIAQYLLVRGKVLMAISNALDALSIFKELRYGFWMAHAYDQVVECNVECGNRKEALRLAQEGLAEINALKEKRPEAMALRTLAYAHLSCDDHKEALSAAEEAVDACAGMNDARWEANMHNDVANIHMAMGNYKLAEKSIEEGIGKMQSVQDKQGEAVMLNTLLEVQLAMDDTRAAMVTVNEQKALFQQAGDRSREALTLMSSASCLSLEGKIDEAFEMLREAREIGEEASDRRIIGRSWNMVAELHMAQGQLEKALVAAEEYRASMRETGDQAEEAKAMSFLCNIHLKRDNPQEAVKLANDAQLIAKRAGDRRMQVTMWTLQAQAQVNLISQGDQAAITKNRNKALKPAQEAVSLAKKLDDKELLGSALHTMGMVQMQTGKANEAMALLSDARLIFHRSGNKAWELDVVLVIAQTQAAKGNEERGREVAQEALMMARELGDRMQERAASALIQKYTPQAQAPQGQWVCAPTGAAPPPSPDAGTDMVAAASGAIVEVQKGLDHETVMGTVNAIAKEIVGGEDLSADVPMMDAGMDSLSALSFRQGLSSQMNMKLPSSFVFDYPTVREVTNRIVELSLEESQ